MRRVICSAALLVLAACGGDAPEEAGGELGLQPIGAPDMEQHGLYGAGCAFVPDGGGIGALFLTNPGAGYIKLDGKVEKLAAVEGSPELPYAARQEYAGGMYAAALVLEGEAASRGRETETYRGRFTVKDDGGDILYDSPGLVECGA